MASKELPTSIKKQNAATNVESKTPLQPANNSSVSKVALVEPPEQQGYSTASGAKFDIRSTQAQVHYNPLPSLDKLDWFLREYTACAALFAQLLTGEEIHEVAFIWLGDKTDITVYEEKRAGLKLFITLERFGIFSHTDLSGLLDIAEHVECKELIEKVKLLKEKSELSRITYADIMVRKSTELEQKIMELEAHLQKVNMEEKHDLWKQEKSSRKTIQLDKGIRVCQE